MAQYFHRSSGTSYRIQVIVFDADGANGQKAQYAVNR
jgi:hypothetical protein